MLGEIAEIVRREKSADHAAGPVAAADDLPYPLQGLVHVAVDLFAGVIHRGEVTARDEGNLIAELMLVLRDLFPDILIVPPFVTQGEPRQRPGHPAAGKAFCECLAHGTHPGQRVKIPFVTAVIAVTAHFDLVDPDHRVECQEPLAHEFGKRRFGSMGFIRPRAQAAAFET